MADLTGQIIDQRYEILELLDEGGMAMVYRINDIRLNRTVALKIIPKERFNKEQLEEILQRFEQEAKALAKLSHPNIVPILDYGEHEGSPYLVLEYLPGGTLRKRMDPPLPWQVAVHVMLPIMDALTYCHQHSILHRDIKPSNILFKEDDTPVLTDFGIAKLLGTAGTPPKTVTGVFVGTPGYMAPEQHNNNNNTKLDARTDVYQLGIVLYEVVTGRRPTDLANLVEKVPHPKEFVPNLPLSLNDVVVTRGATASMLEVRVDVDGDFVANLRADGLIVASPTGSTAYALCGRRADPAPGHRRLGAGADRLAHAVQPPDRVA